MTVQPAVYQPPAQQPAGRRMQGLSFLVHGPPKAGKSSFADTGPRPTVILDVEGTNYWTPSRKTYWDPSRQQPPQPGRHVQAGYGGTAITAAWESAIVLVRDAATVSSAYRVLNSGQHPFNSLSMDSVTETQQRIIDDLVGTKKIDRDAWGALLRQVSAMVRMYRDLITHPVKPLWSVTFVAGTHWRDSKWRPLVQGQAQDYLPYYVDVLGYIAAMQDNSREMLIGPHPQFETGERVGGRLPYSARLGYPGLPGHTIETMLRQVLAGR